MNRAVQAAKRIAHAHATPFQDSRSAANARRIIRGMRDLRWLLGPEAQAEGKTTHLLPRWIFLRALGLIYFSAFYSLLFQIKGLIGPQGILPATDFLSVVPRYYPGAHRFWFAP